MMLVVSFLYFSMKYMGSCPLNGKNHRNKSNRYKLHGRKLYSIRKKGETRRGGEGVMRREEGKKWKGSEN
jgi:hypothetical protein